VSTVFLNGELVPADEACLPVSDRAFLFGDGAYETLRSYGGRIFRFPQHLVRLRETLAGLALDLPYSDEAITDGAYAMIRTDGLADARIRLTVTGGPHDGVIRLRRSGPPSLIMTAVPLTPPPDRLYREGVDVILSRTTVPDDHPLARLKTTSRLVNLMAKEEALTRGAFEALFLDDRRHLLEGTATNIFLVVDGALVTPCLEGPLLAGVTRDLVIETAHEAGLEVKERRVPVETLSRASEAFLTSTTLELLPVRTVDEVPIGAGRPGPVRRELHRRYRATAARETGVPPAPAPGD